MSIIGFIIFGLVIGLLARAIYPGRQNMGWITTAILEWSGPWSAACRSRALRREHAGGRVLGIHAGRLDLVDHRRDHRALGVPGHGGKAKPHRLSTFPAGG